MNLLKAFSFELPTRIEYGPGAVGRLVPVLKEFGFETVMVVTDPGLQQAGLVEGVTRQLSEGGIRREVFAEVEPNPKDRNVQAGAEAADRLKPDCLVAVGGGSPIDCAKAVCVVATHGGRVRDYEKRERITAPVLPLIAIPTTAGTGSEVTFSSVITDSGDQFKFTVKHPAIAPRVALVDPEMTFSMPPGLTAATGMDALTHAIEAFTALAAEPLADATALYAIELIARHLRTAVSDGRNLEARAGMLMGSVLAGIAFSHSDVAAVHCIAEALGGKYDAPHGVCNAVTLPAVMEYNLSHCAERYARIGTAMGVGGEDLEDRARRTVAAVRQLALDVKLPELSSLGVRVEDLPELARNSALNGSNLDNPRPMSEADYLQLFRNLGIR
jgi:alcohol dehydrogenase